MSFLSHFQIYSDPILRAVSNQLVSTNSNVTMTALQTLNSYLQDPDAVLERTKDLQRVSIASFMSTFLNNQMSISRQELRQICLAMEIIVVLIRNRFILLEFQNQNIHLILQELLKTDDDATMVLADRILRELDVAPDDSSRDE